MDIFPPAAQRPRLLEFAKALGCRDNALGRDECGDWRINGKHGHIYAIPGTIDEPKHPGFHIFVMGWATAGWNKARKALDFARVTNDGDDEGALFLDRLPTKAEAEAVRKWTGLPKRRVVNDDVLARLRASGFKPSSLPALAL